MADVTAVRTLGNDRVRLELAEREEVLSAFLEDPTGCFSPQRDGDLVEDGVCAVFIAELNARPSVPAEVTLLSFQTDGLLRIAFRSIGPSSESRDGPALGVR